MTQVINYAFAVVLVVGFIYISIGMTIWTFQSVYNHIISKTEAGKAYETCVEESVKVLEMSTTTLFDGFSCSKNPYLYIIG